MGRLGMDTSIYVCPFTQPRKAEPHSFREKVFRKKPPVCAVCKVTIDGTGISCKGEAACSVTLRASTQHDCVTQLQLADAQNINHNVHAAP